jgi:hypothetical protein
MGVSIAFRSKQGARHKQDQMANKYHRNLSQVEVLGHVWQRIGRHFTGIADLLEHNIEAEGKLFCCADEVEKDVKRRNSRAVSQDYAAILRNEGAGAEEN